MGSLISRLITIVLAAAWLASPWAISAALAQTSAPVAATSKPRVSAGTPKALPAKANHASGAAVLPGSSPAATSAIAQTKSVPPKAASAVSAICTSIKSCEESARIIFSLAWRALVLLGVLSAFWLFCREWLRSPVIIEPLDVPKDLQDIGLTGTVLSQRLSDHIYALQQTARADDGTAEQAIVEIPKMQVDLQLPGTPWSMGSAIRYLKQTLQKRERRIAGDVVPVGKAYAIRLRTSNSNAIDIPVHFKDARGLDRTLDAAAEAVLALVTPIELAAILFSNERPKSGYQKTRKAIELHLSTKPAYSHQAAYIALASIAKEMGDPIAMTEYLGLAKLAGPSGWRRVVLGRLGPRYRNFMGGLARERGAPGDAIKHYKRALFTVPNDIGIRSNLGLAYLDHGQLDKAAWLFRTVIWLRPRSSRGWRGLGLVEMRKGNWTRGVTLFSRAIDIAPLARWPRVNRVDALRVIGDLARSEAEIQAFLTIDPEFGPMYRFWGMVLADRGDFDGAIEKVRNAQALSPADPWNDIELARIYKRLGRSAEAIEWANVALAKRPNYSHALRVLAAARIQTGEFGEAERLFRKAAEVAPWEIWGLLDLSDLLRDRGRPDEAFTAVRQAAERLPSSPDVLRRWAKALGAQGQARAAKEKLQRAIHICPNDVWARLDLSALLRDSGETAAAIKVMEAAIALRTRRADVLRRWAALLAKEGDDQAALAKYQEAVVAGPDDIWARLDLAQFHRQRGRLPEALAAVASAYAHQPHSPDVLGKWASLLALQGDLDAAEIKYRQAIDVAPSDVRALLDLSDLLARRGRPFAALTAAKDACERQPRSSDGLRRWAALLAKQGDWNAVMEKYREAAEAAPSEVAALLDLAALQGQRGCFPDALAAYKSAHERQPGSSEPLRRWAWQLAKQGDARAAEARYKEAIDLAPTDVWALLGLADLHYQRGRHADAMAAVASAYARQPRSSDVLRKWASLLAKQGDWAGAEEKYRQAMDVAPGDVWGFIELAQLLQRRGRLPEALATLAGACRREPRSPEVLRNWATLLAKQGDWNGAEDKYKRAIDAAPGDNRAALDLADLLQQRGLHPQALAWAASACVYQPSSADALRRWAALLAKQGHTQAAVRKYTQAIDAAPADIWPLLDLAQLQVRLGSLPEALNLVARAYAVQPDSPDVLRRWGALLEKQGNTEAAKDKYKQATDAAPNDVSALLDLALLHQRLGHPDDALAAVNRAYERQPFSGEPLRFWAWLLWKQRDETGAADKYRQASEIAPGDVGALLDLAHLTLQRGDSDRSNRGDSVRQQALELIKKAHARQPRAPDVLCRWGALLAEQDVSAAEEKYREAIEAAPGDIDALLDLAASHHHHGRRPEALATLARACERQPRSPDVLRRWASYLKISNADHAEKKYRQAIDLPPFDDIRPLMDYAHFLALRHRDEEALAVAERAIGRQPRSTEAFELWARLLAARSDKRAAGGDTLAAQSDELAARARYKQAIDMSPADDAHCLLEFAEFLEHAGSEDEALAALERAHVRQPRSRTVLHRWAALLEKRGELDTAREKRERASWIELGDPFPLADLSIPDFDIVIPDETIWSRGSGFAGRLSRRLRAVFMRRQIPGGDDA
jgi:tetratricopeptide (TPR) repeat protein